MPLRNTSEFFHLDTLFRYLTQEKLASPSAVTEGDVPKKRSQLFGLTGLLVTALGLKIILMCLFSSGFENDLFLPFIKHYLQNFDNPWQFFYQHSVTADEFPYQPLMLYVLAAACEPLQLLNPWGAWTNRVLCSFFFKLPTLASDIAITWCLLRMFPHRGKQVFWFYFMSPIILYACYLHSQLDLIPTALLFVSAYLLKTKPSCFLSGFVYGLSLATKLHVLSALPIFAIYVYRNRNLKDSLIFLATSLLTYLFWAAPFLTSTGFQHMVLANPKQSRIFEVFAQIGDLRLYIPLFAACILYGRFTMYPKINDDLLDAFLTLIFAVFVMLIVPAPAWYVWIAPFLSLFLIKYQKRNHQLIGLYAWINFFYLCFFVIFHKSDHLDLAFLNTPIVFMNFSSAAQSVVFTLLEVGLFGCIILCYRAGVRSNAIYKHDYAFVIGIGGDSGTGKSTLLQDIKQLLVGRVQELEGDGDHKWVRGHEQWHKHTHLDPKANLLQRQADAILHLKRGRTVQRSDYDHSTGQFSSPKLLHANDFLVLCGLHTFYLPKMRKLIDLKIFMDPAQNVQGVWKLQRDSKERGYHPSQIEEQMERRQSDKQKYILPQREHADLVFHHFSDTRFNPTDVEEVPDLKLTVSISSSVSLEGLLQVLQDMDIVRSWDYDSGLSKQYVTLEQPIPIEFLTRLASELITNLEELVESEIRWSAGYRGTMQLIVLLALSDALKDKDQST